MTNKTTPKVTSSLIFDPAEEEIKAVKDVLSTFLAAVKNYGLFPEDHATTKKVLASVQVTLHKFLRNFGNMRLHVGNDHLLFNDEIVYQAPINTENLAYILFRDGIIWIEFQENLEVRELTQFFRIIHRFKQPLEEPEEDMVTALWTANLPHIVHEAADVFWKAEPIIEFSLLKSKGPKMASDFDPGFWGTEGPWMDGIPGSAFNLPGKTPGAGPGPGGGPGAGPGLGPGNAGTPGAGPGQGPGFGPGQGGAPGMGTGAGTGQGNGPDMGTGVGFGPGAGGGPGMGTGAGPGTTGIPGSGPGLGPGLGAGLGPGLGPGQGGGIDDYRAASNFNDSIMVTISGAQADQTLWHLTEEEEDALKEMIAREENRDTTKDVIEVLMLVLRQEDDHQQFATTLFFLLEEFRSTLELLDFKFAIELLKNIKELSETCKESRPWAARFFNDFYTDIISSDILDVIIALFPKLAPLPADQLKLFSQVLLMLPNKAALTLADMISDLKIDRIRLLMVDIINIMASREFDCLETLLSRPDHDLVQKLVKTLGKTNNDKTTAILLDRMIRHPAVEVRLEALNALIVRECSEYAKLLPLVNDSSDAIRQQLLLYFGQYKNPKVEDLLLNYLTEKQLAEKDSQSLLFYYRALGQCASTKSLPFLKKTLLGKPWNFLFGTGSHTHRHGAAIALSILNTKGSKSVLKRASNSIFPHIKAAARKALEKKK